MLLVLSVMGTREVALQKAYLWPDDQDDAFKDMQPHVGSIVECVLIAPKRWKALRVRSAYRVPCADGCGVFALVAVVTAPVPRSGA